MFGYTNPIFVIVVLLFYIILHHLYRPALYYKGSLPITRKLCGLIIIILLCIYAVQDSDYFHYRDYLITLSSGSEVSSMEDIYAWIASIVSYNYTLFRLLVWGSAIFFFIKSAKRLNSNLCIVLFFFVSMYLSKFSYSRVSLAMAMGLYGYSFIVKSGTNQIVSKLWGIVLVISSIFFHKSAIVFLPLYILSLFKFNKWVYFLLLMLLPVMYYVVSTIGVDYLFSMQSNTIFDYNSAINYLEKSKRSMGIAAVIQRLLERVPYYIIMIIILWDIFKGYYKSRDYSVRCLMNFSLYTILFSSIFLFDFGENNTTIIYYRFLYYSILPLSILLASLWKDKRYKKYILISQKIGYIAVIYSILYSAYNMCFLFF